MPKKGGKRNNRRAGAGPSKGLRVCEEADEQYAVVTQMLGGPNCTVSCQDGQQRLCVIRCKFRWRNKHHNRLSAGTWVMVGVRGWETTAKGAQRCDLLEVYADADVGKLEEASGVDLSRLRRSASAARPGAGGVAGGGPGSDGGPDVVFAEDAGPDVSVADLVKPAVAPVTFGADDDDGEIDMDEI